MTDDNTYTIEIERVGNTVFGPPIEKELTEQGVRELASQLPKKVFLQVAREQLGLEYIEDMVEKETEQQKVSDCCGGEVGNDSPNETFDSFCCKYCGKPCDAVEPNDKIEKLKLHRDGLNNLPRIVEKINEIIEKINNE